MTFVNWLNSVRFWLVLRWRIFTHWWLNLYAKTFKFDCGADFFAEVKYLEIFCGKFDLSDLKKKCEFKFYLIRVLCKTTIYGGQTLVAITSIGDCLSDVAYYGKVHFHLPGRG